MTSTILAIIIILIVVIIFYFGIRIFWNESHEKYYKMFTKLGKHFSTYIEGSSAVIWKFRQNDMEEQICLIDRNQLYIMRIRDLNLFPNYNNVQITKTAEHYIIKQICGISENIKHDGKSFIISTNSWKDNVILCELMNKMLQREIDLEEISSENWMEKMSLQYDWIKYQLAHL